MPEGTIQNPKGAFGYSPFDGTDQQRGVRRIGTFRNVSSANAIQVGHAVCLSSNTSDGTGVIISSNIGDPKFLGIALSSATTDQSTALTSQALPGAWLSVCLEGPCVAVLSTAAAPGNMLINAGNSTLGGTTGSTVGGQLMPLSTATITGLTPAAGTVFSVAGACVTTGTTGTTGFLSAGTTFPKGLVYIKTGYANPTTA